MFNQRVGREREGVPHLHFIRLEMGGCRILDWPLGFKSVLESIWGGENGKFEILCSTYIRCFAPLQFYEWLVLVPISSMWTSKLLRDF